jgi:hypothetical protein
MLKVCLYTALNGGNPTGDERIFENLKANARSLFPFETKYQDNIKEVLNHPLFKTSKLILDQFTLTKELKDFNKECYSQGTGKTYYTYTIDRPEPYICNLPHQGISRVLQGFEVVLLSYLTRIVLTTGGLPISLDHDGLLIAYPSYITPDSKQELEDLLTNKMYYISNHLLKAPMPIEVKNFITPTSKLD